MTDPAAPHGYDDDGKPNAPYGYTVSGVPRKSNRGARAGQKGNRATTAKKGPTASISNLTDADRKAMLVELGDMAVVTPLATAARVPMIQRWIGEKQADALAGDAFIFSQFAPGFADGLILMAKTKPATLAWLEKIEEHAAVAVLASTGIQMVKAIAQNHFNPNPTLARAGQSLAAMRMQAMAESVIAQAEAATVDSWEDTAKFEGAAYERATAEAV